MTQLAAQTALATGANRGLGREFVHQLLERGVAMVYAAARDPQAIVVTDSRVVPLQFDVTDLASVARAAEFADDVSVVVNNSGISLAAPVLGEDTSQLRRELEVNSSGRWRSPPPSPTASPRRPCGVRPTRCDSSSAHAECRSSGSTWDMSTPT
jgi:NAD(P)-dependent dehydrogenase (short-subunit alcohol dehydrogenase family)